LRQRRDADGALAALDAYDARFPRGTLRREAEGARVDALLLLGRDAEALALLRRLALAPQGRDQELRVIRGELEAGASPAAAVDDFDRVLDEAPPAALAERALYGRAACLLRAGDRAAAGRDLRAYLGRFPAGRFANEARRLVDENDL
jgi:TolA-binding protein